jgi:hypothetical protein
MIHVQLFRLHGITFLRKGIHSVQNMEYLQLKSHPVAVGKWAIPAI